MQSTRVAPSDFPIRDEQRVTSEAPAVDGSPRSNGLEVTPVGITLTRSANPRRALLVHRKGGAAAWAARSGARWDR